MTTPHSEGRFGLGDPTSPQAARLACTHKSELITYEIPYYPSAELPPKNIVEEITDLATEVVDHLAYMKTEEAQEISHRILKLIQKYDCLSNDLKRQVTIFAKFDPTYRPPPNFLAQFQEHKSLFEQLEQFNKDHRYALALKLFTTPPKGNA